MSARHTISLTVNGTRQVAEVEPRMLLSDFLRHRLGLTGTHVGCEHGVCGACTVLFNGEAVRSCLTLAVQADDAEVTTVEGLQRLSGDGERLHPLQETFLECRGLQCGFCTPGFLISIFAYLRETPGVAALSEEEIRIALSGNLCRCTGYQSIVKAVRRAAAIEGGEA